MSRGQQEDVIATSKAQNATEFQNSQNSYTAAQKDIGNYKDQLANYAATDPYQAGGEFQTAEEQQIANTADSTATAAGNELQSQALRTGGNTAAAGAQEEAIAQAMERSNASNQAAATEARIGSEAQYKTNVLQGEQFPVQAESSLSGQQGSEANASLNTQNAASSTPSFWDTFGDAFASAAGKFLGSGPKSGGSGGGGGGSYYDNSGGGGSAGDPTGYSDGSGGFGGANTGDGQGEDVAFI